MDAIFINDSFNRRVLFLFLLEELLSLCINARLKAQEPNEHVATRHERRT